MIEPAATASAPRRLDPEALPDHVTRLYRAAWAMCGCREDAESPHGSGGRIGSRHRGGHGADVASTGARRRVSHRVTSTPVDAASTTAWSELTELAATSSPDLRSWFAEDPGRVERYTVTAGDLFVDLSKNLLDDDVLAALLRLADQVGLAERRDARFRGERINVTEDRPALHTALRSPRPVMLDGRDVTEDVKRVRAQMRS